MIYPVLKPSFCPFVRSGGILFIQPFAGVCDPVLGKIKILCSFFLIGNHVKAVRPRKYRGTQNVFFILLNAFECGNAFPDNFRKNVFFCKKG